MIRNFWPWNKHTFSDKQNFDVNKSKNKRVKAMIFSEYNLEHFL